MCVNGHLREPGGRETGLLSDFGKVRRRARAPADVAAYPHSLTGAGHAE